MILQVYIPLLLEHAVYIYGGESGVIILSGSASQKGVIIGTVTYIVE